MTESAPATPRSTGRSTGGRRAVALLAIAATLTVAVAGAILTSGTGWLNTLVDRVAGESGGFVGGLLPLGFAFSAGMASAFNPCGFPLLPTYLGLFLAEGDDPGAHARVATRLARALAVGGAVTVGFVLLFSVVGVTVGVGARVVDWLPWVALGFGVALVLAAGYRLTGGSIYSAAPERLGARVGAGERGVGAMFCLAWPTASRHSAAPSRSSSRWSAHRSSPPPCGRLWERSRSTGWAWVRSS